MVLNRFPMWKNILVLGVMLVAFLYASPNLYGDDPAIQIMGANPSVSMDVNTEAQVKSLLDANSVPYKKLEIKDRKLLVRFYSNDVQLKARELVQDGLGNNYLVALNLASKTPTWLTNLGALPMKLGLDLRGGIHLLIEVDADALFKQRIEGDLNNIAQRLRTERIRYASIKMLPSGGGVTLQLRTPEVLNQAYYLMTQNFQEFSWTTEGLTLKGVLSPTTVQAAHQDIMEQTMSTLRQRVNELGVSEAIVQQQGASRIAVDLPGIQDTAQAKNILGKTATLEFHLVDVENDPRSAINGLAPIDTKLYIYENHPYLLKNSIILRGSTIISATSGIAEDSRASVNVRLAGTGDSLFTRATAENIGKPMAVLYVDTIPETKTTNGQKTITYHTEKKIISVARINSALGNSFQITGLDTQEEARTLALLLRAGALPVPVAVIEEREVGPTLGLQNIHKGITSVAVGFLLVVLFMAVYYRVFGLIANLALGMNLILIVAILSILGGTLTLPGIAGIVLTVGMAADANILIFERIREEIRNGSGIQASIHAGYERAFVTIVDSNLTTLIVTVVLFSLGSGAVKSFAITVTIGLITSMFTAITGTRAIVNFLYGGKTLKRISIGI